MFQATHDLWAGSDLMYQLENKRQISRRSHMLTLHPGWLNMSAGSTRPQLIRQLPANLCKRWIMLTVQKYLLGVTVLVLASTISSDQCDRC